MASAVETDLSQLDLLFSLHKRIGGGDRHARDRARDPRAGARGARLRARGQGRRASTRIMLADKPVRARAARSSRTLDAPPAHARMARRREARRVRGRRRRRRATRSPIGLFDAWWRPFLRYGVIHGDPHLGNYAVVATGGRGAPVEGINLFDYGCVRIFPPRSSRGVVELYHALRANDEELCARPTRSGASRN